jgi:hypothetical protein
MQSASRYRLAALVFAVIVASAVSGFVAGCGGSRGIRTSVSDDGTTTRTLANSEVKLEGAIKYTGSDERDYVVEKQCFLDYRSRETASRMMKYEIVLTYIGVEELGIEPGRSLELQADLNSYVLTAEGPAKRQRDPTGKSYTETLVYQVSSEQLLKLSQAESVQVIVNGRAGEAKGSFDAVNFAHLRGFVAECVKPIGSGSSQK